MKKAKYGYMGCAKGRGGEQGKRNGLPVMKKLKYGQMGGVRGALNLAKSELKELNFTKKRAKKSEKELNLISKITWHPV